MNKANRANQAKARQSQATKQPPKTAEQITAERTASTARAQGLAPPKPTLGARVQAAGVKTANHISRNKAAYIAGGLGTAAIAGGAALAARAKKKSREEG